MTILQRIDLGFEAFLKRVTPNWSWDWPHLQYARRYLDKLTRGEIEQLICNMPVRHGKTEHNTVRWVAWRLVEDPTLRVVIAAYNQRQANKFSRKVRRIVEGLLAISPDRDAVEEWETLAGGGLRAVGVGGGITGEGFDILVIDDPVKSREEADSEAYRERVWEWYHDDLYTRKEPGAIILLTMSRWHEDDLVGRILKSEDAAYWTVINLPALCEGNDPEDYLPKRQIGEALCPQRYSAKRLIRIKSVLGRSFYALHQGTPHPSEGNLYKRAWFKIIKFCPPRERSVRYWDEAATKKKSADYSVGLRLTKTTEGRYVIEDVARGQWSAHERCQMRDLLCKLDNEELKNNILTVVEQQPGSAGVEVAENAIKSLAGFAVKADKVTGDKVTRSESAARMAEAGFISLIEAPWNEAFLTEICRFPDGHDDQADALSGAFKHLTTAAAAGGNVNVEDARLAYGTKDDWRDYVGR